MTTNRDPRIDPRPGDQLHDAIFAGGAIFTVKAAYKPNPKSISSRGRRGYIHCGIKCDDGRAIEQRGRIYGYWCWSEQFGKCEVVKVADVD